MKYYLMSDTKPYIIDCQNVKKKLMSPNKLHKFKKNFIRSEMNYFHVFITLEGVFFELFSKFACYENSNSKQASSVGAFYTRIEFRLKIRTIKIWC